MIKIGITGQSGFIGTHLYNTLGLYPETYERIPFEKDIFDDGDKLDVFVSSCDVIVHLAAMNRHDDEQVIYDTNTTLVNKLVDALERTLATPHILISSSTQEERDNLYGKSKKEGRRSLVQWAKKNNATFTGLIIPNVFGPFGKPFYNSVVATFCHQLTHNATPKIDNDGEVPLIYVGELVAEICKCITSKTNEAKLKVSATQTIRVSEILRLLEYYKGVYFEKGEIPVIKSGFETNLFNTFRSYIDPESFFPNEFTLHSDDRGSFVEIIRLGIGGQVSFSTTGPGVTRGNHFHTRKIERFAVIKGKALIQLRRIGTDKVFDFYLDGDKPAYVDMPVWYTHNIKNIGDEVLYTNFWINEPYDPEDTDTYFESVQ